jgi:phosphoglycerate kinase
VPPAIEPQNLPEEYNKGPEKPNSGHTTRRLSLLVLEGSAKINTMKTIQQAPIHKGTKVFVRGDLDVPIGNGTIQDTTRLDNTLETLRYIIEKGGFPIIGGHIGRPKGEYKEELSTKHILPYFIEKLGESTFELVENLRFDPREKENSAEYAKELADKAEIYVNDSFSTCHREHASVTGIPQCLPAYAGISLQRELEVLGKTRQNPQKPLVIIVGGIKLDDKLPVIHKFIHVANTILLGGKAGLHWTEDVPENLILPLDYAQDSLDIGPQTVELYKKYIAAAKTIVWAGPVGKFEDDKFFEGTKQIASAMAQATQENGAFTLIGGGDTLAAVKKAGYIDKISFASAGGSAMLKYLANGNLVGLEKLA